MRTLFSEINKTILALKPQAINAAATANGETIPMDTIRKGRAIAFIMLSGALTSVTVLKINIQGRLASDGSTWEDFQDKDAADLQFTAAKTIDNGALENGVLVGTIPTGKIPTTYDAIRLIVATVTGGNTVLAALAVVNDLLDEPSGDVDDFIEKLIEAS